MSCTSSHVPLLFPQRSRQVKQLEEEAFDVEQAHAILMSHLGEGGDAVKDAVLSEWCSESEVGIDPQVALADKDQRVIALQRVAKWLFE